MAQKHTASIDPDERPHNIDAEDFSKYFCAYGFLYNQKEMLEDEVRMTVSMHNAYHLLYFWSYCNIKYMFNWRYNICSNPII